VRLPPVPTIGLLALAAGLRLGAAGTLGLHPAFRGPLGAEPWHRPPLLDWLTLLVAPGRRELVAVASGVLVVWLIGRLALRALGVRGALIAMAAAALSPALVQAGSWWSLQNLTVPLTAATALALLGALDRPERGRLAALFGLAALLAASDWTAWPPVLAWGIWLAAFRPHWLEPRTAHRVAAALFAGFAVAGMLYLLMSARGADPRGAMGWSSIPTGLPALQGHVDSIAALLAGRVRQLTPWARLSMALATAAVAVVGARRAQADAPTWTTALAAGSLGALAIALVIHPWIPVAVEKALWFMTPLVLCLGVAAISPPRACALGQTAPMRSRATLPFLLALALGGCDADEDGWTEAAGDCNDEAASVHPGAPEVWNDGVDNDCDGVIDDSADYRFVDEVEPNDVTLADCFAPSGQDLGDVAAFGLLNRLSGRIDSVVDESYVDGDLDCYVLRLPDDAGHPRLEVRLDWTNPDSDLDFAVQGLWEGEQSGFALADLPGPPPEVAITSSGFDGGAPLWLWIVGYTGEPTDYTVDLVLR